MLSSVNLVLLLAITGIAIAQLLAESVPQSLDRRIARLGGGWALQGKGCPSGASFCGSRWCCPSSQTCISTGASDIAEGCCEGTDSCLSTIEAQPYCADYFWGLWNATKSGVEFPYFCCLPTQVGLQSGECVDAVSVAAVTGAAELIFSASSASSSSKSHTSTAPSTGATQQSSSSGAAQSSKVGTGTSTSASTSPSATGKSDAASMARLPLLLYVALGAVLGTIVWR